jgi:predicted dehydrogenase
MVHRLLGEERLGRPLVAEVRVRTARNDAYYHPAARRESWDVDGGGVLMVVAIHQLDLLLTMLGDPLEASAQMDTFCKPTEGEDSLVAWIRFRSGALASVECTVCGQEDMFAVDLLGTKARVRISRDRVGAGCRWELAARDRPTREALHAIARREVPRATFEPGPRLVRVLERLARLRGRPWAPPQQLSHLPAVTAFLDAVRAGRPAPVDPRDARRSLELVAGLYHSARSGRVVRFPLDRTFPDYHGIRADGVPTAHRAS